MKDPSWVYTSSIYLPTGILVSVSVHVPAGRTWTDMGETSELAAMTAARLESQIRQSMTNKKASA